MSDLGRDLPTVAIVSTVRAPLDVLEDFVHYHLRLGAARIYLFFDDPEDPAAAALESHSSIEVHRCDAAHWQRFAPPPPGEQRLHGEKQTLNATRGLELARAAGFDWLAHLDSDELLHLEDGSLGALVARARPHVDGLLVCPLEGVPDALECDRPFHDIRLFRARTTWALPISFGWSRRLQHLARTLQFWTARMLGCGRAFYRGDYLRGYRSFKAIVRTASPELREVRPHLPRPTAKLALRFTHRAAVLHFDCCTFSEWRRKWDGRHAGVEVYRNLRPNRIRQGEEFLAARNSGDDAALERLYWKLYSIPERLRGRLSTLRMLRRVTIDATQFSAP